MPKRDESKRAMPTRQRGQKKKWAKQKLDAWCSRPRPRRFRVNTEPPKANPKTGREAKWVTGRPGKRSGSTQGIDAVLRVARKTPLCVGPDSDWYLLLLITRPRALAALHDETGAAALLLVVVLDAHLGDAVGLSARGRARVRRHFLVVPADLPYDVVKGVVDVDARLGRRLDELAAKLPREILALWAGVRHAREREGWDGAHLVSTLDARHRDRTCCPRRSWGSSPCP